MRDAIIYSTWNWATFNVPERIALALTNLGARVLYCEHPRSGLRKSNANSGEVEPGITVFQPTFLADRANGIPVLREAQAKALARQISEKADELELNSPLFFYPFMGSQIGLLPELEDRYTLVHIQMDYGEANVEDHVELSDFTLTIPRSVYHQQRGRFGDKIRLIPQVVDLRHFEDTEKNPLKPSSLLEAIGHPRLGYLGAPVDRVNREAVVEILKKRPEWNFITVDSEKAVPLPNAHAVPRRAGREMARYAAGFDVGFMPYDCMASHNLHCLPLKLFEYFALGLPVVSTPILELWDLRHVVYLGDTAEELIHALEEALQEPLDSPKRRQRVEIAQNHSIEALAGSLRRALPLDE